MLVIETAPGFFPEKQYALDVLLGEVLGLSFRLMAVEEGRDYRIILPNKKEIVVEDHFFGKTGSEGYLHATNIPDQAVPLPHPFETGENLTLIYGRPFVDDVTCGIDLVASAFFMLTRWEEYVRPERDRHGRFPAAAALAVRAGFLHRPVVDEYAALLAQMLRRQGLQWSPPETPFRLHLSHDVDHPRLWWRAADRWRTLAGSMFRRFSPSEALFWLKNGARDPFDTFDWLMDIAEKKGLAAQFNFMGERPRSSDCWYPLGHPFVRELMQKIETRGHVIGFHPSYESYENEGRFQAELASLRAVSPLPVTSGRQHYLRFSAPRTWRMWFDAGLGTDSTLGYAEAPGFRCGICREFSVFDFLKRQPLPLREKPLLAMDVSFAKYRKENPESTLAALNQLRSRVRLHRGEFTLLWHNSSLNDYFWQPWRTVYESFVSS